MRDKEGYATNWQPLYDFQALNSGPVPRRFAFFQKPIGTEDTTGKMKTLEDTNMYLPAMLPSDVTFIATAIKLHFIPNWPALDDCSSNLKDVRTMLNNGYLTLRIVNKEYICDGPLGIFPSFIPTYYKDDEITKEIERLAKKRWLLRMRPIRYEITPLKIDPLSSFSVHVHSSRELQLASPGRLGVILDGFTTRPL